MMSVNLNGNVLGYDPGGNGNHGLAIIEIKNNDIERIQAFTCHDLNEIIAKSTLTTNLLAIGIDTLTCWSGSESGWRPADKWLRQEYPAVQNSVVASNSLYGAMCVNGMGFLISMKLLLVNVPIIEAHPKLLFYALFDNQIVYENTNVWLSQLIGKKVEVRNEDEADAVLSAYSAYKGLLKEWTHDLHNLEGGKQDLIFPCGKSFFFWPYEARAKN